jgi:hypothetical protein
MGTFATLAPVACLPTSEPKCGSGHLHRIRGLGWAETYLRRGGDGILRFLGVLVASHAWKEKKGRVLFDQHSEMKSGYSGFILTDDLTNNFYWDLYVGDWDFR